MSCQDYIKEIIDGVEHFICQDEQRAGYIGPDWLALSVVALAVVLIVLILWRVSVRTQSQI